MTYREHGMWEALEVLRRVHRGEAVRSVARATGRSRGTVRRYVAAAAALGWSPGDGEPGEELAGRVLARLRPGPRDGEATATEGHRRLRRPGERCGVKRRESDLDRTRALLAELGFEHVPSALPDLVEHGVREEMSLPVFLDLVLDRERAFREERRVKASLKISGLPVGKTLESYDFAFQRGVDRGRIELLSTCELARRRENVLLLGPPGVKRRPILVS